MKNLLLLTVLISSASYAAETCSPGPLKKIVKKHIAKKVQPKKMLVLESSNLAFSCPTASPVYLRAAELPVFGQVMNAAPVPAEVDQELILGGRLAVGFGPRVPNLTALLGLRAHYVPWHLGAEAYTLFNHGWGGQVLVYPYQGQKIDVHVNLGIVATAGAKLSTQDLSRPWDLTIGAGLEYHLFKHLSLVADYRIAIPSLIFIANHNNKVYSNGAQVTGPAGQYLHVGHVLGNCLTQGQVLLGIMLRN